MKNKFALLLTVTGLTLSVVWVSAHRKLANHRTELASMRAELEEKSQMVEDLQRYQHQSEKERRHLLRQADELASHLQAKQSVINQASSPAPSNSSAIIEDAKSEKNAFGKFISQLMQDPEARKFIRDQQRMMMDQLYAPLFKQMGLMPEEAEKLKDFLADRQLEGAEQASSLFVGSATNRAETLNALNADQQEADKQVRQFLGESRYALYKDYQQTIGERAQLIQFKQQMAGGQNPLTDQQLEQLLALMREEKENVAAATGQPLSGTGHDEANLQAMLSGDQTEKLLDAFETVSKRTYERASGLLLPDQLTVFGRFQTNQLQAMRMGMKLFVAHKSDSVATAPNP
jgi:phage terminase small subunit